MLFVAEAGILQFHKRCAGQIQAIAAGVEVPVGTTTVQLTHLFPLDPGRFPFRFPATGAFVRV